MCQWLHRPSAKRFVAVCLAVFCLSPAARSDDASIPPSAPSEADCQRAADDFARFINQNRVAAAAVLVDWGNVFDRATRNCGAGVVVERVREDFRDEFLRSVRGNGGPAAQIAATVGQGGGYRLLRMHLVDGKPHGLFRLLLPAGAGVNYHDAEFVVAENGAVLIGDLLTALTGESISQSLRRTYLQRIAGVEGAELGPRELSLVNNVNTLKGMSDAIDAEDYAGALAIFRKLPAPLQHDTQVMQLRLRAAQGSDADELDQAAADYSAFANCGSFVELPLIDGFVLQGRFGRALESVDRLDQGLGGDPYLNVLRAGITYQAGELDRANGFARRAIEQESGLEDAYWQLTTISLDRQDFRTTAEMLTALESNFHVKLQDLTGVPAYAEFVKSDAYRRWQRSR